MEETARPLLLTTEEAAEYLGIGRHQLAELVREGVLAFVQLPCHKFKRFTVADLDACIQRHTAGPKVGPTAPSEAVQVVESEPGLAQVQPTKKRGDVLWLQRYKRK